MRTAWLYAIRRAFRNDFPLYFLFYGKYLHRACGNGCCSYCFALQTLANYRCSSCLHRVASCCTYRYLTKREFTKIIDAPFEDTTAKIPAGYDSFLTRTYGNYMTLPPEEDRIAHHFYSAFKK